MTKQEFETAAGFEVNERLFNNVIDRMCNGASLNLDPELFVKLVDVSMFKPIKAEDLKESEIMMLSRFYARPAEKIVKGSWSRFDIEKVKSYYEHKERYGRQ